MQCHTLQVWQMCNTWVHGMMHAMSEVQWIEHSLGMVCTTRLDKSQNCYTHALSNRPRCWFNIDDDALLLRQHSMGLASS
jgi:hypothetical protein